MTPNADRSGITVRKGHTVHLGASLGRVDRVQGGMARVHWASGYEAWERCSRLQVNTTLGRVVRGRP